MNPEQWLSLKWNGGSTMSDRWLNQSKIIQYTDVNGVINIGIVNDWLYIENTYGNNKISNMDKIFDVKFDLNKENSNGLGLYIVSNILNNYNMEYKALQDEEFFIFKIKIFS